MCRQPSVRMLLNALSLSQNFERGGEGECLFEKPLQVLDDVLYDPGNNDNGRGCAKDVVLNVVEKLGIESAAALRQDKSPMPAQEIWFFLGNQS